MNANHRKELLRSGYLVGAQIGKGTFGTVFQCTDVRTQVTYALKAMDLRTLRMRAEFQESRLMREVQVMRKLNHPFIVHLHDVILSEDALFLVMELIIGVDLFDTIVARGGFDEDGARFIFYQLCLALDYIHDQGILHRDVKPENILLRGPTMLPGASIEMIGSVPAKTWIKLVDFGLSKLQGSGELNSFVGTPRYIAPEVITVGEEEKRRRQQSTKMDDGTNDDESSPSTPAPTYSTPADCFSAGICLFVMMANCFPKFNQGVIVFEGGNGRAAALSPEAKDLIIRLTDADPSRRLTMKQALQHPWLTPAQPWVTKLVTADTSLVLSRSSSNGHRMSLKRPLKSTPTMGLFGGNAPPTWDGHSNHSQFQFTGFGGTQQVPTLSAGNGASLFPQQTQPAQQPQQAQLLHHPFGETPQRPSHTALSVPNGYDYLNGMNSSSSTVSALPLSVHSSQLVSELDREWRNASSASPALCSRPDVRNCARSISNLVIQSERVVLRCAQTGSNVLDSIPDIRLMVDSGPLSASMEAIKMILSTIREWVVGLKKTVSEMLQLNHQTVISMGALVQNLSTSPDVIAESIAAINVGSPANGIQANNSTTGASPDLTASSLFRCINHLESIERLLRNLESYWVRMDTALGVLEQRAAIIATLAESVSRTPSMEARFLQKLDEYFYLWRGAALLSQQFVNAPQPSNSSPAQQPTSASASSPAAMMGSAAGDLGGSQEGFFPSSSAVGGNQFIGGATTGFASNSQPATADVSGYFGAQHHHHAIPIPHHNLNHPAPPPSTVVVTHETSPAGSLESYEGDI